MGFNVILGHYSMNEYHSSIMLGLVEALRPYYQKPLYEVAPDEIVYRVIEILDGLAYYLNNNRDGLFLKEQLASAFRVNVSEIIVSDYSSEAIKEANKLRFQRPPIRALHPSLLGGCFGGHIVRLELDPSDWVEYAKAFVTLTKARLIRMISKGKVKKPGAALPWSARLRAEILAASGIPLKVIPMVDELPNEAYVGEVEVDEEVDETEVEETDEITETDEEITETDEEITETDEEIDEDETGEDETGEDETGEDETEVEEDEEIIEEEITE